MWDIDENANILRRCDWFNPPNLPSKAALIIRGRTKSGIGRGIRYNKINIGPTFCHVLKIAQLIHEIPSITWGIQKWRGGYPSFNIVPKINKSWGLHINAKLAGHIIKIAPKSKKQEPTACGIKYLIAASDRLVSFVISKTGINESKLSSIPTQSSNQLFVDRIRIVDVKRVDKNRTFEGLNRIMEDGKY